MLSPPNLKGNFCVVFTYSIKRACEIRKFHVAAVQLWQRNVQNSVMHVQFCCFVNKNLLLFCRSPSIAVVVVGFVLIQKYCSNGDMTSYLSSLFFSLEVINTFLLHSECLFVLKTPFLYIKFTTWTIHYTFIKYLLLDNYVLHITLL